MLPVFYQAFSLYQAYHLSEQSSLDQRTKKQKAVSFLASELFFYLAYRHYSAHSLVTQTTAKCLYGMVALLPVGKIAARWAVWHLGWLGTEGAEVEKQMTYLIEISRNLLMQGVKIHAIALLILKQELRPLIFFVPHLVDKWVQESEHLEPKTERSVKALKEALYNLCLFFPLSIPYYVIEVVAIAFFKKQYGPYISFLLENFLAGLEACKNANLGEFDELTPAYFAVLKEVERLQEGKVHADIRKYPERERKLHELKEALDLLSPAELDQLKKDILEGKRGSELVLLIKSLTGYYTGAAADLLKKDHFFPYQKIAEDPRTVKRYEQIKCHRKRSGEKK